MLEFEIAALYYFVAGILNLPAYFDEVPEDMEIPCQCCCFLVKSRVSLP